MHVGYMSLVGFLVVFKVVFDDLDCIWVPRGLYVCGYVVIKMCNLGPYVEQRIGLKCYECCGSSLFYTTSSCSYVVLSRSNAVRFKNKACAESARYAMPRSPVEDCTW